MEEDIEMKTEIQDINNQKDKLAGIYLDFVKTLITIAKNVKMKDLKTLDINLIRIKVGLTIRYVILFWN